MTEILLENIIKAINTELKNGLIYVVIDNNYNHYNCYEPIDIYDGGNKIGFYDDEDTRIILNHKEIDGIKIAKM